MFLNLRARSAKFCQNMPFYIRFHLINPFRWFTLPLSNNLHGQKQLRKILKWGHCVFWATTFGEICCNIESTESLLNKESFKPFFNQNCQCHLVIIIGETGPSVYLSWSRLKFDSQCVLETFMYLKFVFLLTHWDSHFKYKVIIQMGKKPSRKRSGQLFWNVSQNTLILFSNYRSSFQ